MILHTKKDLTDKSNIKGQYRRKYMLFEPVRVQIEEIKAT